MKQQVGKLFNLSDGSVSVCIDFAGNIGSDYKCRLKFAHEDGVYYNAQQLIDSKIRQVDGSYCATFKHLENGKLVE